MVSTKSSIKKPLHTASILDSAQDGRPLSAQEALHLLELTDSNDLALLRKTAGEVARRQTPVPVLPGFSCSLYLTNLCELQPSIYPYPKQPGQSGAYTLTIDDIDAVLELCGPQKGFLTVSGGGFWSALSIPGLEKNGLLKTYAHLLNHIREKCPNIRISGFSPDEVEFLSIVSSRSPRYILELLKDHGLETLGSHPAGLLVSSVRKKISPKLQPIKDWLELAQMAAQLGIPTLLGGELGHVETLADRVQHLLRVRELLQAHAAAQFETPIFAQVKTHLLNCNSAARTDWPGLKHASAQDRFKWLALRRILLGQWIPVQQSFWQIDSADPLDEASEGLSWGANTLGNTDSLCHASFLLDSQPKNRLFPHFTQAELQSRQAEAFDIGR
jgi:2-iminoacetate synthase ThiH